MDRSTHTRLIRDAIRDLDRQIQITETEMHELQIRYRQLMTEKALLIAEMTETKTTALWAFFRRK